MVEDTIQEKEGKNGKAIEEMTLDELDELEDEEDERILLQYRYDLYYHYVPERELLHSCGILVVSSANNSYSLLIECDHADSSAWQRFWPTSKKQNLGL